MNAPRWIGQTLWVALVLVAIFMSAGPTDAAFPGGNGEIAFWSQRGVGGSEIYVMNSDGSAQTNLSRSPLIDYTPAWSPDGSRIAFSAVPSSTVVELWVMNSDGTEHAKLDFLGGKPSWSPDGTKIVYERFGEIRVINSDGTGAMKISGGAGSGSSDGDPTWSPDGTKIAFSRYPETSPDRDIWVMNPDGTGQTQVTSGT